LISFGLVLLITMVLSLSERAIPFENLLFGPFRLSEPWIVDGHHAVPQAGLKVFIIITMFAGRVGPLTLATAFARRSGPETPV
jgi:trk system potassium uptake protein TrkH